MPVTKESLLQQVADCRRRLLFVLELRNEVAGAVDRTSRRLNDDISLAASTSVVGDAASIDSMILKMENASNVLKEYERGMEDVRATHDMVETELNGSMRRLNAIVNTNWDTTAYRPVIPVGLYGGNVPAATSTPVFGATVNYDVETVTAASEQANAATLNRVLTGMEHLSLNEHLVAEMSHQNGGREQLSNDSGTRNAPGHRIAESHSDTTYEAVAAAIQVATQNGNGKVAAVSGASNAARIDDYRKHVVSRGNGQANAVCQHSVILPKEPMACVVTHIEDPGLFWVQLTAYNMVEEIEDTLNQLLEDNPGPWSKPIVGDYCAAPSEDDDDYHRVKILEIKPNKSGVLFAKILYIDNGKVDWVTTKVLLELPGQLLHRPRQACPCALDVEPISGFWDDDIIAKFRELCVSDSLLVERLSSRQESPDVFLVSLRLVDGQTSAPGTMAIRLIASTNQRLKRCDSSAVEKGFKQESGKEIGGDEPPESMDDWRCVLKFHPASTPVQKNTKTNTGPARRMEAAGGCTRHQTFKQKKITKVSQATSVKSLPLPVIAASNYGDFYFVVTLAISPEEFYIQIRDQFNRNDDLDQLMKDLIVFYASPTNQILVTQACPQLAVVQWSVDGRMAYRRVNITKWLSNRADTHSESTATAFFIDEGFTEVLRTKELFILDRRFCGLPAQSSRCKLNDCQPAFTNWDQTSIDLFRGLCQCRRTLMKGVLMTETEPYEIVAYRQEERNGPATCLNGKMVELGWARSETMWK